MSASLLSELATSRQTAATLENGTAEKIGLNR
jgi:hypothetical protein